LHASAHHSAVAPLAPSQEAQLAAVVHPAYLKASTMAAVRSQLESQGAALLASFLRPEIAAALAHAALAADRRDGLDGGEMPSTGPPYAAGTRRPGWRLLGPPQLRRYLRYRPRPATAAEVEGHGADGDAGGAEGEGGGTRRLRGVGAQLEAVREVMSSAPFVQWLAHLSGLTPRSCAAEVRRFRPGLDYSLAHVGTQCTHETLDATLTFVASRAEECAAWESGDVGGFECHVQASDEDHGAADVYKADESSAGVTSIHPQTNALSLVRRGTDTMKFIKYVSAAAPGSRWDVAASYVCGAML